MSDIISEIKPGQPLSDKQREELAKANAESSAEAHRLAAEHRARDMAQGGNEAPVAQVVAGSILEKLKTLPPEKTEEQK